MKFILVLLSAILCCFGSAVDFRRWESRIISGTPALPNQFPWQVLIKKNANDYPYCGGSIISADWVLTAGHCVENLKSIHMAFGTVDLNDLQVQMTSDHFITHENYNPDNLNNDIALIKLPNSLTFNDRIQPIKLVPRSIAGNDFAGKRCLVSGWGYISDEDLEYSNVLLYTQMDVITNQKCKETYAESTVIESTICAKSITINNESICNGDSGGAMVIDDKTEKIQIGINSFVAQEICAEGYPAGFVRVGSFLNFIEKETNIKIE